MKRKERRRPRDIMDPRYISAGQESFLATGMTLTGEELGFGPSEPHLLKGFTEEDMEKFKLLWSWHKEKLLARFEPEEIWAWSILEDKNE